MKTKTFKVPRRCPTCKDVATVRFENIGNCPDLWHIHDGAAIVQHRARLLVNKIKRGLRK